MKRIKTIVSFLCAAALALTLLVMPSSASGGLFFLSLNDTLPAQSVQMTPVQYSGWVYVPVNVFNSQSTGVNFGAFRMKNSRLEQLGEDFLIESEVEYPCSPESWKKSEQ